MIAYPLRVDGTMTRVFECGIGPALVLIHGLGSRADRWRRNIEGLAASGRRIFAVDLPGHGFARKDPEYDYSVNGYAAFIQSFLNTNGIERAALVGASLGGQIAAAFAVRERNRLKPWCWSGAPVLRHSGLKGRAQASRMLVDMSREAIRGRLRRGLRNEALITNELIEEDFRINNSAGAAEAFQALGRYFAARIDDDLVREQLIAQRSHPPILLVWGIEDLSIPMSVGEAAHAKLAGARMAAIAGTAHNPYMDKPEVFNRVLLDFLAGRLGTFTADDVSYR